MLVARRREPLEQFAEGVRAEFGVETSCVEGDLATRRSCGRCSRLRAARPGPARLQRRTLAHRGVRRPAHGRSDEGRRRQRAGAPSLLVRALLPRMLARGRGGVILMSSLAGMIGAPRVATYAASKAFNRILAQALWYEVKGKNIDMLACCAGATRTPGLRQRVRQGRSRHAQPRATWPNRLCAPSARADHGPRSGQPRWPTSSSTGCCREKRR